MKNKNNKGRNLPGRATFALMGWLNGDRTLDQRNHNPLL